jgi:hypothetical protein
MDCLRRQLPALQEQFRADGDFRPYPATWLNQTPWLDPEVSRPAERKSIDIFDQAAASALKEAA